MFNQNSYNGTIPYHGRFEPEDPALAQAIVQAGSPAATTLFGYDLLGNRTSVIDAEGNTTAFAFNYKGQPVLITDALSQTTELAYSGSGCGSCGSGVDKLTSLTDAKNQTTHLRYHPTGDLKSETDPLGYTILYDFAPGARLSRTFRDTNGNGEIDGGDELLMSYAYAPSGQLLSKTDHVTGEATTFSYYPNGRLQTAVNPAIGYTFEYYTNGWLKKVTDSNGRVISYDQYNGAGQRQQVTYLPGSPDQKTIGYGYDAAGRLSTLTSAAGPFSFGYDARSRRGTLSYPNGVTAAYGYHPDRDWLTSLVYRDSSAADLLNIAYPQHDLVGNRTQKTRDGVPTSYGYDDLYQLTSAASGGATEAFTFDPVGNRQSGPGGTESYYHDAANRMLSGRQGSYQYDERGNQTVRSIPDGTWSLTWSGENRLIEASKPGTTVTFKYDPFGRRIEKKTVDASGTTTRTYVYDGEDIVFEFTEDGAGTTTTHFVHGPGIDEPLALVRNGQSFFYHADGLGSIVALTDSGQNVVQSYHYEAFGKTAASGSLNQPYGFTGREFDSETGLYFYRARYYDPAEGRFLGKDPISFAAGDMNLFRYVGNNSPNLTDPSGLIAPAVVGLYYVGAKAVAISIPWATMKIAAHFMGNPEVPGTVGNYRLGNLADDLALTTAGVNVASAPLVAAPMCAGAGTAAVVNSAPTVYYASMAAAGTPVGQTIINEFPDVIENFITPAPPTKFSWGALLGWFLGGAPGGTER